MALATNINVKNWRNRPTLLHSSLLHS